MKTNKYKFKQSELYTIARLVLSYVSYSLTRFTAFKGKYTAAWVTDRLAEVDAAEDLPDEQQRDETHQTIHVQLDTLIQTALNQFNSLKRYIVEVFPENVWDIKIDAAGGSFYSATSAGDFDSCNQLLTKGSQFIADNLTQLLDSGNNMPAIFQTNFDALKTNFKTKHNNFLLSEAGAEAGTEDKIDANNNIYKIITSINADAQAIFTAEDEESERNQFILEQQLLLVRGAGVAGMRIHVTDSITEEDIQGVLITIKPGVTVTTDSAGRALKLQLAADTYSIKVQKAGYVQQEIPIIVQTGTVKRVNISFVAV